MHLPAAGGATQAIDTGFAVNCNNDHGISPDGTMLAFSDNSQETKSADGKTGHDSLVYVMPILTVAAVVARHRSRTWAVRWAPKVTSRRQESFA